MFVFNVPLLRVIAVVDVKESCRLTVPEGAFIAIVTPIDTPEVVKFTELLA